MKQSLLFVPTLRDVPSDAEISSHQLMLRGGYIKQSAAGIYSYLPLAYKVIKKIENIIREELDALGCSELLMPALQSKDIWEESGRWNDYGSELIRLKDRKDRDFCLGPTHEEVITSVVREYLNSYKKFPLALYQIQTKFRDELRPRFGLMRGREFIMKDLYTFHTSSEDLDKWYDEIAKAYKKIYNRCGLDVKVVHSETGQMGGKEAHEFMVMSEVGEDLICYSTESDFGANIEKYDLKVGDPSPDGKGTIEIAKGIEVGNIFKLGTRYSESMNGFYLDSNGKRQPFLMGCYGIGVSRILMSVMEQHGTDTNIVWPKELSPFDVHIVIVNTKDETQVEVAQKVYNSLKNSGLEVLIDDRAERAGVKFKDADLIGAPKRIIIGKGVSEGLVEYLELKDSVKNNVIVDEIITLVTK